MQKLKELSSEWFGNTTGFNKTVFFFIPERTSGLVQCTEVTSTIVIIVTVGVINTVLKLICKGVDQYDFFNSEENTQIKTTKQRAKYYINSMFHDVNISKAFEHKNTRYYSNIGAFLAFKPLASLVSDVLNTFYRALTINEGWKIDGLGLTMILLLSFTETLIQCYITLNLNRHKAEIFTNLTLKPIILFSEFIYFDRQIDDSNLILAYFVTLFDFFRTIAEYKIIRTMLECDNDDTYDFSEYSEQLNAYETDNQSVSTVKQSKFKKVGFQVISSNKKNKSLEEPDNSKSKFINIWINETSNTKYTMDLSKVVMLYTVSANLIIDFNRTFYFTKSMYQFLGTARHSIFKIFYRMYSVEFQPVMNQSCTQKSYFQTYNYRKLPDLTFNATHYTILGRSLPKDNFTLTEEERHDLLSNHYEWDFIRTVILTTVVFFHYIAVLLACFLNKNNPKIRSNQNLYEQILFSLYNLSANVNFVYLCLVLAAATVSVNLILYDFEMMGLENKYFSGAVKIYLINIILCAPVLYNTVLIRDFTPGMSQRTDAVLKLYYTALIIVLIISLIFVLFVPLVFETSKFPLVNSIFIAQWSTILLTVCSRGIIENISRIAASEKPFFIEILKVFYVKNIDNLILSAKNKDIMSWFDIFMLSSNMFSIVWLCTIVTMIFIF